MAEYVYEGPGPQEDGDGGIARPGDIREFDAEPAWGPWRLLEEPFRAPETPVAPAPPPPAPRPAEPPAAPPLAATGTEGA